MLLILLLHCPPEYTSTADSCDIACALKHRPHWTSRQHHKVRNGQNSNQGIETGCAAPISLSLHCSQLNHMTNVSNDHISVTMHRLCALDTEQKCMLYEQQLHGKTVAKGGKQVATTAVAHPCILHYLRPQLWQALSQLCCSRSSCCRNTFCPTCRGRLQ